MWLQKSPSLLNQKVCVAICIYLVSPFVCAQGFSLNDVSGGLALALSLPLWLIGGMFSRYKIFPWQLLLLNLLLLFAVLSLITIDTHHLGLKELTACGFLAAITLVVPAFHAQPKLSSLNNNVIGVMAFSGGIFMLLLFMEVASSGILWSALLIIFMVSNSVRLFSLAPHYNFSLVRLIAQLLLVAIFGGVIYWQIDLVHRFDLIIMCALSCYCISVINSLFMLTQNTLARRKLLEPFAAPKKIAKQDVDSHILSGEEYFSYSHDYATQLPSYQHAIAHLSQIMALSVNRKYAVIVFKPINFKDANQALGHRNLDILLLQLAYSLKGHLKANELLVNFESSEQVVRVAKLQGLNFLMVFDITHPQHPEEEMIAQLCLDLGHAVPQGISFNDFSLNFELAFGVAITSEHGSSIDEFIAHADDALQDAISHNTTLSYFDNCEITYASDKLSKIERFKRALHHDDFYWSLQPQIHIKDQEVLGFDLLVQWQDERGKKLNNHQLCDLAEDSSDIHLFTKKMIDSALVAIGSFQSLAIEQTVTVSITSVKVLESDLVDYIETQIQVHNSLASYLTIALSEEVLLSSAEKAKEFIDQLRALGVGICIDNFSGSYESLRYIRKKAVDQVKINCENLDALNDNIIDKAIITTLIDLCSRMVLPVIGKGLNERSSEEAFLSIGGNIGQGYIVYSGIAIDDFDVWLKAAPIQV